MNPTTIRIVQLLLLLLPPILASLFSSKLYWGYYFAPPYFDLSDYNINRYRSLSQVTYIADTDKLTLSPVSDLEIEAGASKYEQFDYDHPNLRALFFLQSQNPERLDNDVLEPSMVRSAIKELSGSGTFETHNIGKIEISGISLLGLDPEGKEKLLLFLMSEQISNDHYPLYDIAYDNTSGSVLYSSKYYEDIAGIEGLRAPVFFIPFFVVWILVYSIFYLLFFDKTSKRYDLEKQTENTEIQSYHDDKNT